VADRSVGDRAVERLLRRELGQLSAEVHPSGCIDAETLAAWAAGSMPADTSTGIEAHLASCDRCQTMVALFAGSEPPAPVAAPPFWRRWTLRVLVPVAAASVVVLAWVGLTRDENPPAETMVARVERAGGEVPAPVPVPVAPGAPEALANADASARTAAEPPASQPATQPPAGPAPAETGGALIRPEPPPVLRSAAGLARQEAAGAAVPLPPPPAAAPSQNVPPPPPPPAPPAPASPPAPGPPPTAAAAARAEAAPAGPAAPGPDAPAAFAAPGAADAAGRTLDIAGAGVAAQPVIFATPAGDVRWRIAGGRLERSTDAGSSWAPAPLAFDVFVVAGAAPSADVCWVVGRGGQVLISVNGQPFTRTAFNDSADLVGVTAIDALRATVQAADGRSFTTTDGGATWAAE